MSTGVAHLPVVLVVAEAFGHLRLQFDPQCPALHTGRCLHRGALAARSADAVGGSPQGVGRLAEQARATRCPPSVRRPYIYGSLGFACTRPLACIALTDPFFVVATSTSHHNHHHHYD